MKKGEEFSVKYDGNHYENHTMPADELAAALTGFGELLKEASLVVNKDVATVDLRVKAHNAGSFEIVFDVVQQAAPLMEQLKSVANSSEVNAFLNAREILGLLFGGTSGLGLLGILKWLEGRKVESVTQTGEDFVLKTEEGEKKKVTKFELDLFRSIKVRQEVEEITTKRLTNGANSISFSYSDKSGKKITESIKEEQGAYFIAPEDEQGEPEVIVNEYETHLAIVSLVFRDDNKWRFDDGSVTFYAILNDEEFLKKVKAKQVAFSDGDTLLVDLRKTQYKTSDGKLNAEYEIVKVKEHISPASQLKLKFTTEISDPEV